MALIDNLVSYWKLDENAANTTVADAHASNTGTSSTNTSNLYNASGILNSCFLFNGSNEDVGTSLAFPTGAWSFSCWTYQTSQASWSATCGASNLSPWIGIGANGIIRVHDTIASFNDTDGTPCSTNQWDHIVVTWDGSSTMHIYVNDTDEAFTNSGGFGNQTGTGFHLASNVSTGNWFNGRMDEVGLWSRELTSAEVTELYGGGTSPPPYPFTTGPDFTLLQFNVGDSWKLGAGAQLNVGDSWKEVAGMQQNIGDNWKAVL